MIFNNQYVAEWTNRPINGGGSGGGVDVSILYRYKKGVWDMLLRGHYPTSSQTPIQIPRIMK